MHELEKCVLTWLSKCGASYAVSIYNFRILKYNYLWPPGRRCDWLPKPRAFSLVGPVGCRICEVAGPGESERRPVSDSFCVRWISPPPKTSLSSAKIFWRAAKYDASLSCSVLLSFLAIAEGGVAVVDPGLVGLLRIFICGTVHNTVRPLNWNCWSNFIVGFPHFWRIHCPGCVLPYNLRYRIGIAKDVFELERAFLWMAHRHIVLSNSRFYPDVLIFLMIIVGWGRMVII